MYCVDKPPGHNHRRRGNTPPPPPPPPLPPATESRTMPVAPAATPVPARLLSLDAFRGFVVLAMVWLNYIAGMPGLPHWLQHAGAGADGVTLPDLVFPAFLFIVGVAIPLALQRQRGRVGLPLLGRLGWRAAGLMLAGVVLANAYRYDAAAAALPRALYFVLFYAALILLWRQSASRGAAFYTGAALMLALLLAFRGTLNGEFDRVWLQHSWWGILGMIGWTYLFCSLIYLATGGNRAALMGALAGLVALYMGGRVGSLDFLPAQLTQLVNVPELLGSTAANVLAGTVVGTLFVRDGDAPATSHGQRIGFMAWFAAGLVAAGMLLRPYHHINKIHATESYTLVCAGAALALFLLFYIVIDVLAWRRWSAPLLPAGGNALFAYIVPDLCEQLAALLRLPRLWWPYLATGGGAGLLNAAAVTACMMLIVALANRHGLRLKF
ncbi:heparan-alpha-glucosaminide N-acetyltransferase [Janthinobacterium sp. CG_23.3]